VGLKLAIVSITFIMTCRNNKLT